MENPESSPPDPISDRTEEFASSPASDPDRTTTLPSPPISQADADKRLAAELGRRGVPPDEIQRLVALGRPTTPTPAAKTPVPSIVIPTELIKEEPFVPKPDITLPEFRDSNEKERADADRLLTAANLARRRGNFKEAESSVRAALELTPKDAAALELYGDILQSVGRVDDAAFAYGRAMEADSNRKTAEKKYAELALLQNRAVHLLRDEYIPRSPFIAILFSAVFPGAGQLYNGDTVKGLITAILTLILVVGIFWSPWGIPSQKTEQIPTSVIVLILLFSAVYLFAVIDANISAKRGRRLKSGWEV
jgi:TM2 domain-containing membrane protein YozV